MQLLFWVRVTEGNIKYIQSMAGLQNSLSCCAMMKKKRKKKARCEVIRKEIDCVTRFCYPVILLNFLKTLAAELNYKMKTNLFKERFSEFCARIKLRYYKPNNSLKCKKKN